MRVGIAFLAVVVLGLSFMSFEKVRNYDRFLSRHDQTLASAEEVLAAVSTRNQDLEACNRTYGEINSIFRGVIKDIDLARKILGDARSRHESAERSAREEVANLTRMRSDARDVVTQLKGDLEKAVARLSRDAETIVSLQREISSGLGERQKDMDDRLGHLRKREASFSANLAQLTSVADKLGETATKIAADRSTVDRVGRMIETSARNMEDSTKRVLDAIANLRKIQKDEGPEEALRREMVERMFESLRPKEDWLLLAWLLDGFKRKSFEQVSQALDNRDLLLDPDLREQVRKAQLEARWPKNKAIGYEKFRERILPKPLGRD